MSRTHGEFVTVDTKKRTKAESGGARSPSNFHRKISSTFIPQNFDVMSIPYVLWQGQLLSPCDIATESCMRLFLLSIKHFGSPSHVSFHWTRCLSHIADPCGTHKIDLPMSARPTKLILSPRRSVYNRPDTHHSDFCYMPSEDLWRPCAMNAIRHDDIRCIFAGTRQL